MKERDSESSFGGSLLVSRRSCSIGVIYHDRSFTGGFTGRYGIKRMLKGPVKYLYVHFDRGSISFHDRA